MADYDALLVSMLLMNQTLHDLPGSDPRTCLVQVIYLINERKLLIFRLVY